MLSLLRAFRDGLERERPFPYPGSQSSDFIWPFPLFLQPSTWYMFLVIPRLFSISQVSSFGILSAGASIMFNICPSAFHCFENPKECNSLLLSVQNSNNLLSKWEPSPICLHSFSHPLPLLIESALPYSNTLISLLAYLLPYLLQVSLPITPFLQGLCEPCITWTHI